MNKCNKSISNKCTVSQSLLFAQGSAQGIWNKKVNSYSRKYGFAVFYKKELKFWFD